MRPLERFFAEGYVTRLCMSLSVEQSRASHAKSMRPHHKESVMCNKLRSQFGGLSVSDVLCDVKEFYEGSAQMSNRIFHSFVVVVQRL